MDTAPPLWLSGYKADLSRQLYAFERLTLGYHPSRLRSERWWPAWWPYRAARRLKQARTEARSRLSLAADVLKHGHDCY